MPTWPLLDKYGLRTAKIVAHCVYPLIIILVFSVGCFLRASYYSDKLGICVFLALITLSAMFYLIKANFWMRETIKEFNKS